MSSSRRQQHAIIETPRLKLISCTLEVFEALEKGREHLGMLLKVRIPDHWPLFPESISYFHEPLKVDPELRGWGTWLVVLKEDHVIIGEGGYGGKPGANGQVEIGYGILPDHRGKGLATEFAQALIDHAFNDKRVQQVQAGTLKSGDDSEASMRVLEKLGFVKTTELPESFRWQLPRQKS